MKQLYIIDYESSQWCGGQLFVICHAESAEDAKLFADYPMEETQRDLFQDEYCDLLEEGGDDSDCAYIVNSVSVLDENNENWLFYTDPSQSEFYPYIGEA
jgi:hypothetical protein